MKIGTRASIEITRSAETVFDGSTDPAGFPAVFAKVGLIPGVVSAELIGGGQQREGSRRRLSMSDGAELVEEVLSFDRPHRHRYRWQGPKFPFSLLVKSGEGDWRFHALSERRTKIDWTYTFEITSPAVYPLARIVTALFQRWMERNLERLDERLRS